MKGRGTELKERKGKGKKDKLNIKKRVGKAGEERTRKKSEREKVKK